MLLLVLAGHIRVGTLGALHLDLDSGALLGHPDPSFPTLGRAPGRRADRSWTGRDAYSHTLKRQRIIVQRWTEVNPDDPVPARGGSRSWG